MRAMVLTSFMNEDRTSLMNFRRFVALDEPNCLLCCVYGGDGNVCHPSQTCPLLLNGCRCLKCIGSHPRSLHERRYGVDCLGQIQRERYWILLWAIWHCNPSNMHKAMPKLKNITRDEELVWWMGLKALGRSITNFTWLIDACIRMLEQNNHKKIQF